MIRTDSLVAGRGVGVGRAHRVSPPPAAVVSTSLALVVLIGLADLGTGYEFTLSILYLLPIFSSTWLVGFAAGTGVSVAATLTWFVTDLVGGHEYSGAFYRYWEATIKLTVFVILAAMLSRLKLALARSDERLQTVLERLDTAVCVLDPEEDTLLFANQRFKDDFAADWAAGVAERLRELLKTGGPFAGHGAGSARWHAVDGFEEHHAGRWHLVRARPLRWIDGRTVALLTATDVTESKRAEQRARQQHQRLEATAKLVAVGEMASMLAHQINQPLSAVVNYSRTCLRRLRSGVTDPTQLVPILEQVSGEAARAATIIQRVREFVRRREPRRSPIEVNPMVQETLALVRSEAEKQGVDLAFEPAAGLPRVDADRVLVEQVLMNLLENGIEAMRDAAGGTRELRVTTALHDARLVRISVSDRGCGIPADLIEDLFRPFFTTKQEGMGLGLSVCRSIVEFHGGMLWATANPDSGSAFHFTLPTEELPT